MYLISLFILVMGMCLFVDIGGMYYLIYVFKSFMRSLLIFVEWCFVYRLIVFM